MSSHEAAGFPPRGARAYTHNAPGKPGGFIGWIGMMLVLYTDPRAAPLSRQSRSAAGFFSTIFDRN